MSYTKGLWSIDEIMPDVIIDSEGGVVAENVCQDDARLIAAAPDLLDELENCADLLDMCFSNAPVDSCIGVALIKAKAAISKATGETA